MPNVTLLTVLLLMLTDPGVFVPLMKAMIAWLTLFAGVATLLFLIFVVWLAAAVALEPVLATMSAPESTSADSPRKWLPCDARSPPTVHVKSDPPAEWLQMKPSLLFVKVLRVTRRELTESMALSCAPCVKLFAK